MLTQHGELTAHEIAPDFLARMLRPYQPTGTVYLRSATVRDTCLSNPAPPTRALFSTSGVFSIGSSCYIQATGHFNAVEFLICYNQLAYSTFGYLIQSGVFRNGTPTRLPQECREMVSKISMERFLDHQLSSMLILKCTTRFREPINARSFTGHLSVNRLTYHKGAFLADTRCVFTGSAGGSAEGDVLLAYVANIAREQRPSISDDANDHARAFA